MTDDPSDAPPWRILTWNVHGAAGPDLEAIAEVLRGLHPDAVSLQELRRRQASTLAGLLGWQHHWTRKHYSYSPALWWRAEGLAILTPHALRESRQRSITPDVSTWTHRHRVAVAATIERPGRDRIRLYDTHLASHDAADERITQARRLADMVLEESAAAPVVAGDLNADGEVEVIRELHRAGVRDPGGGPTHPSICPKHRFDFVLVPETATVLDRMGIGFSEPKKPY